MKEKKKRELQQGVNMDLAPTVVHLKLKNCFDAILASCREELFKTWIRIFNTVRELVCLCYGTYVPSEAQILLRSSSPYKLKS